MIESASFSIKLLGKCFMCILAEWNLEINPNETYFVVWVVQPSSLDIDSLEESLVFSNM